MEEIRICRARSTKPHRCRSCGGTIPARAEAVKCTKTTTTYTCMDCEKKPTPVPVKTNFNQITASPAALAAFLGALPVLTGPWDTAFHRKFCDTCPAENCDACPNEARRDNPEWWLGLEVESIGENPAGGCPGAAADTGG